MLLRRQGACVEVWAAAKVNLFLEILGRRPDGYHELESLVAPVAIYDTLYFQADSGPERNSEIRLECGWTSGWQGEERRRVPAAAEIGGELPAGGDNLAVQAAELLRRRAGSTQGGRMRLVKRIPAAAGLGGASSDAAAALAAANAAWNIGWPAERLRELGAELGSDVPFFLGRGAAIMRGRGERLQAVDDLPRLHLVVVRPPQGLATREVYARCRVPARPLSAAPLVAALRRGRVTQAGRLWFNRLQEAAQELSPWMGRLFRLFDDCGAQGYGMTGSGTACYGVSATAAQARRMARRIGSRGVGRVFATHTIATMPNRGWAPNA